MPVVHVVKQGECLSAIARKYGFADYQRIYRHPDNDAFRQKRQDPNVIHPGDEIVIPDKSQKAESVGTEKAHVFKVAIPKRRLKLTLKDASGDPIAGVPYVLRVEQMAIEGTTGDDGVIEVDIPLFARTGTLMMNGLERELRIGDLNPMKHAHDVSGVQARLQNLGYPPGRIDGIYGKRTAAAIRAFQSDHGMDPDGEISDALVARLEAEHGS
jgi:murein L,D-transpeptidase YcbB/YkuD